MSGTRLPLIIKVENQQNISAALMNEKAFSKSREQGELWLVHPLTGRILPHQSGRKFLSLEKQGNSYRCLLPEGSDPEAYREQIPCGDAESHASLSRQEGGSRGNSGILENLEQLIAGRHKTMPAGSYTSHLFEKGPDKIRKKCGEEAVEFILAEKPEDLVYEAADLIYHMMVLLEARDLSIQDVLRELEKRERLSSNPQ